MTVLDDINDKEYIKKNARFFVQGSPHFSLTEQARVYRERRDLVPRVKEWANNVRESDQRDIESLKKTRAEFEQKIRQINERIKSLGGKP